MIKTKLNSLAATMLLALVFSNPAFANANFGQLTESCKAGVKHVELAANDSLKQDLNLQLQAEKCWTYLSAFQEALAWVSVKKATINGKQPSLQEVMKQLPFCIPDNVSNKQLALVLINHAEKNTDHAKWPAAPVVGEILSEFFPCQHQQ